VFPLLLVLIGFSAFVPIARVDSFGYYATGLFQFDSNAISGHAAGICEGLCAPCGEVVILDVSFSASVIDFQESVSCANNQCDADNRQVLAPVLPPRSSRFMMVLRKDII
jgi:hypothetical protein